MSTRRQFLVNCSATALTLVAAPTVLAGSRQASEEAPGGFDFPAFEREQGTAFTVNREHGSSVSVRLVRAELQQANRSESLPAPDAAHEKFSLLFEGPISQPLDQDTYQFAQPRLGRFDMFIVPVGAPDPRCCYYEAIFNRPLHHGLVTVRNGDSNLVAPPKAAAPPTI